MEKKLLSIQFPGNRIQLIVKNDNVKLIHNRKVVNVDYEYRKNWAEGSKILHSIHDLWEIWYLNEVIWRIKDDKSIICPDELWKNENQRS